MNFMDTLPMAINTLLICIGTAVSSILWALRQTEGRTMCRKEAVHDSPLTKNGMHSISLALFGVGTPRWAGQLWNAAWFSISIMTWTQSVPLEVEQHTLFSRAFLRTSIRCRFSLCIMLWLDQLIYEAKKGWGEGFRCKLIVHLPQAL